MRTCVYLLFSLLIVFGGLSAQEFPPPNVDFKYHQINNVKFAVGNTGNNDATYYGISGYSYSLVYPTSSNNSFLAWNGFWLGALVGGDTLASISGAYDSQGSPGGSIHEFAPKRDENHVLYTSNIFEKQNPEIDPNTMATFFDDNGLLSDDYYPISHEDIICQYYDNKVTKETPEAPDIFRLHEPMNAHIIQRSYAWSNEWYENIIFVDYFIINEHDSSWKDVYFGVYSDPHSGDFSKGVTISDDLSYWDEAGKFMVQGDNVGTGGDDFPNNELIGWNVLGISKPGESVTVSGLNNRFWSWEHGPKDPHTNGDYYREMSKNEIDRTYTDETTGSMRGLFAKGPYPELASGDTIRITIALAGGAGIDELRANMKNAKSLYSAGFQVPKSPNPPKFKLEPVDKGVRIDWKWYDDYEGHKPEESIDNSRNDGITKDFDGFRIYRSEKSEYGPWELIAQYDSINGSGYDSGLRYSIVDEGLKNGLRYYYSVTSFDMRDDSSGIGPLESPRNYLVKSTMPGPTPESSDEAEVFVVPNPYRADVDYSSNPQWEFPTQDLRDDWYEIDRRIAFMNLPAHCKIHIFTINGIKVNTLDHNRELKGHNIAGWNLLNNNNHAVGSGVYYFVVEGTESDKGFKQVGKFVIVK
ncbi:MAG: hypothetical protein ACLFQM_00255 [Fidelibacterota bacterium]